MKRMLKISVTTLILFILAFSTLIPVNAAEDKLNFNTTSAKVGDTVTYTLKLGKCEENVMGFQMYLFYDSSYLEVVPGSFSCPNIPNALFNENPTSPAADPSEGSEEPGVQKTIPVVFSDAVNTLDFSETKDFLTVKFKVIAAGDSDISYFFTELYGSDMTYLKSFELTSDIAVNDKKVVRDAAPKLAEGEDVLNNYQGAFINYSDGKDDQKATEDYHQVVTGDIPATEVTQDASPSSTQTKSKDNGGGFPFQIILFIVIGVAFIAVIGGAIVTIIRKR